MAIYLSGKHEADAYRQAAHVLADIFDPISMSEDEKNAVWLLLRFVKTKEASSRSGLPDVATVETP